MGESEYLSPAELHQLTGAARRIAQCKRLRLMGYPFEVGYDGCPLVSRQFARNRALGVPVELQTGPRMEFVR